MVCASLVAVPTGASGRAPRPHSGGGGGGLFPRPAGAPTGRRPHLVARPKLYPENPFYFHIHEFREYQRVKGYECDSTQNRYSVGDPLAIAVLHKRSYQWCCCQNSLSIKDVPTDPSLLDTWSQVCWPFIIGCYWFDVFEYYLSMEFQSICVCNLLIRFLVYLGYCDKHTFQWTAWGIPIIPYTSSTWWGHLVHPPPPPWSKHSHGRRTAVVRPTVAILLRHSAVLSVSCRYTFCPLLPTAGPHEFNPSMPFSACERLGEPPPQLVCSLCRVGGSYNLLVHVLWDLCIWRYGHVLQLFCVPPNHL